MLTKEEEACEKVEKYFKDMNSELLGFDVYSATFNDKTQIWTIDCSFYDLEIKKRVRYIVIIDKNGQIKEVK